MIVNREKYEDLYTIGCADGLINSLLLLLSLSLSAFHHRFYSRSLTKICLWQDDLSKLVRPNDRQRHNKKISFSRQKTIERYLLINHEKREKGEKIDIYESMNRFVVLFQFFF